MPYELPKAPSLELIAKLGVLADYYDCVKLVKYYADISLTPETLAMAQTVVNDEYKRDLIMRVWVTWLFDHPSRFRSYTSSVVQLAQAPNCSPGLSIPSKVIDEMNNRRTAAIEKASSLLAAERHAILRDKTRCTPACRSVTLGTLLIFINTNRVLIPKGPYVGIVLRDLVASMKALKTPTWREYVLRDNHPYRWHECDYSSFTEIFRSLSDQVDGLELSAFKPSA
ncbi:hypothetical protein BDW62DRAFT_204685 [Aspergillus aurantiobrunneus]